MSHSPALLAVFGNPVEHSLSPLIHDFFAKQEGRAIKYEKRLVEGDFATCARKFFAEGGIGCNVTVPCKIEAFNFVTGKSKRAIAAQAVNTIVSSCDSAGERTYWGDNTDGFGLFNDLLRLYCPLKGSRILIIGAGGAARGILPALQNDGSMQSITIVNRTTAKAQELIASMQEFYAQNLPEKQLCPMSACSFADLQDSKLRFEVLINATSLSMSKSLPDLKDDYYRHARFAYDLFYTPEGKTVFTEQAKSLGVSESFDGLGMLVGQAALAYEQWFNSRPDINSTLEYMRKVLAARA